MSAIESVSLWQFSLSPMVKTFLAGSFSGTCSTLLFQPLDLVKTRVQSAIYLESSGASTGLFSVLGSVVKNERVFGLWKGMTPSMARCVPGVGIYFSSLHWLKSHLSDDQTGPLHDMTLGATARSLTTMTMIPFTVIKTRFESKVYNYGSIQGAVRMIYMREGTKGLCCGLLPTLLRDAPFSGLYLMFYKQTKNIVPQDLFDSRLSSVVHFSSGVTAGMLASIATQPFDVLKTKMQLYPDRFAHLFEAAVFVHSKYGVGGFFKGLVPRTLRRSLMAAMAWTVYEQLIKTGGLK